MKKKDLEKCKQYERQILRKIGFEDNEFKVSECHLTDTDYIHYVNIKKKAATQDNVLLMAHGFMGNNIFFFKLYNILKNDFNIYSIDLPGQGLSSSLKKTPKTDVDWIEYFVSNIKNFCDKMGLKKFSICGHSMGGYLLTHFSNKYPNMILDSFLLSPAGINKENPEFIKKREELIQSKNAFIRCIGRKYIKKIFEDKLAPFDIWFLTLFRSTFVKKMFKGGMAKLDKEEQESFIPLYKFIFNSKPSSDNCVGYLFKTGPMSNQPLMPIFEKLHNHMNILILYGDADWNDYAFTQKEFEKKDLMVNVDFLDNCDHNIPFQNPEKAGTLIINKRREWKLLKENSKQE